MFFYANKGKSSRILLVGGSLMRLFFLFMLLLFSVAADLVEAPRARIITAKGEILCKLHAQEAPNSVDVFVELSSHGFYDGTWITRLIPHTLIIQGSDGREELFSSSNFISDRSSPRVKGSLSWVPFSNAKGPFFYITMDNLPDTADGSLVFGTVTSGMDVIEKLVIGDKKKKSL
jgi:peptidyl-prolyl cis-trans isomerase B (cyclophilin B)